MFGVIYKQLWYCKYRDRAKMGDRGLMRVPFNEISVLLKAVKDEFFTVSFPDPQEGKVITKTMYVGSRTAPVYTWHKGVPQWTSLSMNFIER